MKMILCLKHGQADIERGFSINKNLLKDNMEEVTKELLKSVKSARILYDEYLSDQKKEKFEKQKRKMIWHWF